MEGAVMDEDRIRAEIGRRLAKARQAVGLKTEDVAAMMDVAPRNVVAWEKGSKTCTLPKLSVLATMYNVSADRLLGNFPPDHESSEESRYSRLREELESLRAEREQLNQMILYFREKSDPTRTLVPSVSSPQAHHGYVPPSPQAVCGVKHWRRETRCVVPYAAHTGPHDNGEGLRWTNERMSL